jgi:hypothetical protein
MTQPTGNHNDEVELATAIRALRSSLVSALHDGDTSKIRFHIEHVDLTMQVSVTKAHKGSAEVRWHVLGLGGERLREQAGVQTLNLRLSPIVFDDANRPLAADEQFISDFEGEGEGEGED